MATATQEQLYNLQIQVQNENMGTVIQKLQEFLQSDGRTLSQGWAFLSLGRCAISLILYTQSQPTAGQRSRPWWASDAMSPHAPQKLPPPPDTSSFPRSHSQISIPPHLLPQPINLVCACWVASVVSDCLWPYGLNPPGSSVHGILQARILEWVAISFSRELLPVQESLPNPGIKPVSPVSPALQADSLPLSHQGSPLSILCMPR